MSRWLRELKRMIFCILICTFFLGSLLLIVGTPDGIFIYATTFLFTTCCTIYIAPLLYVLYRNIDMFPRRIFQILFRASRSPTNLW